MLLGYHRLKHVRPQSLKSTLAHLAFIGAIALLFFAHGSFGENVERAILCGTLLSLASIDLHSGYVPNVALLPLIGICVVRLSIGEHPFSDVFAAMLLGGTGIGLHLIGDGASFGLGDVKLLGLVGCIFGVERGLYVLGSAFVIGASIALVLIAIRRYNRKTAIPFVPMICLAVLWEVGARAV